MWNKNANNSILRFIPFDLLLRTVLNSILCTGKLLSNRVLTILVCATF